MRTLWLLRHAKAAADSSSDHERPLAASGREAASKLGRYLAERGRRPELVLCSSALRTRQTLDELGVAFEAPLASEIERDLYLASAGDLFSRVQELPGTARDVLLIAHNPGIGELAKMLATRGPAELRRQMRHRYPTCALAELRLEAPSWSDLSIGCELVDFVESPGLAGAS